MLPAGRRLRDHALDALAGAFALAYLAQLLVVEPGSPAAVRIGEVAFFPPGLLVAWLYARNAGVPGVDGRTRLAWRLLAGGSLCLWFSGVAWTFWIDLSGGAPYPTWIDRVAFLQFGLSIVGYLAFPSLPRRREGRTRYLLDLGLTMVAGFMLAFHFGLLALLRSNRLVDALLESALEWLLFVLAAVGYLRKRDPVVRSVMGLLLAANCLYMLGSYHLARLPTYLVGHPIDAFWFGAWVLRFTAARLAWFRYRLAPARRDEPDAEGGLAYRSGVFSYVLVGGAFLLLVTRILEGDQEHLGLLATSAAVMAGFLVARLVVELRENQRLLAAQLAQESRFRSLVQHASDVVLVVDGAGFVTYASPSASRSFGERLAAGGAATPLSELVHREDLEALGQAMRHGAEVASLQPARMRTGEGAWRDMEIIPSDLRHDPAVGGFVLTCRDVTGRNELERQLRHAQRLDTIGQLAGGLAHDFNNVLAVIRGFTDLLQEDLPPDSPAADDLRHIQQASDRAAAVTKKLLSLSRRQAVQRTTLDLNAVLEGLAPILRQLVTPRVELRLECAPDLWPVLADQGQLEQVVINLAANARDAMPAGGALRIATSNRTGGGAPGEAAGPCVALVISDQGEGMSDEVRARIFEPFFSTKASDRGMGLGLAMVAGIVTESGGTIAVDSSPGQGATFTVLLPRAAGAVARAAAPEPLAPRAPAACTVLVADDDASVRTATRRILSRHGYRVVEAQGGQEALETAARLGAALDLLVTDLVMPDLHGTEVIAELRRTRPGLPAICMTGFAGGADDARELGGDGALVLAKPFSAEALLRVVQAALTARGR